jgi:hypothetical protein
MTPLSALFQIFTLLKVIAQTEMASVAVAEKKIGISPMKVKKKRRR